MKTDYTAQAEALSTAQLQGILEERSQYEPQAILAVIAELERREVEVPEQEQLKQELTEAMHPAPETLSQKFKNFLQVFVPKEHYFVTPILLNLNLLVFIVGALLGVHVLDPDAGRLVELGANFGPYTLTGQWWRLLTSMFLHGGIVHLLFNMVALVNIGMQLEALVGRVQFMLAYLLCGLAGSIASLWWTSPDISVSVGASGAIFGLFGMLLMLLLLERELDWKSKRAILGNMVFVIGINLAYGMRGGIDNAAHIGGLVAGLLVGGILLLRSDRYITQTYGLLGNAVTVAAGMLVLFIWFKQIPFTGKVRYVYTTEQVGKLEASAIKVAQAIDKAGKDYNAEELLPLLKKGIAQWEEGEVLLENIDDAPAGEEARVAAMLDYVRLRKLSYQMLHDDMKANRPIMHAKQQQMMYAINQYVHQLQNNSFDEDKPGNVTIPEIKDSQGNPVQPGQMQEAISDPFFVIDGVEIGTESEAKEEMQNINPNSIESITVLKGEEAMAIYGEKAAGGAVIITTKK